MSTEKLQAIERKAWWKQSQGFRKLIYMPGVDYDMLQGQLRQDEILCCWYHHPAGQTTVSHLMHVVPVTFEERIRNTGVEQIVGFYALTSVFRKEAQSL